MLAIKKYFGSRKRRNSADYDSVGYAYESSSTVSPRPASPAPHSIGKGQREAARDPPPPRQNYNCRRSVSLGQILQRSDSSSSDVSSLYNAVGGYYRDPRGSPRPYKHAHARTHTEQGVGSELSDFEKENLLFVKDLDNSYHRPCLEHSLSNASLCSNFSEDSLTGDSTPRGGSPYPGRRDYPRAAHRPSKNSTSCLIRSVSKEEEEEEEENANHYSTATRVYGCMGSTPPVTPSFTSPSYRRKISMPILSSDRGDWSTWWTNRNPRLQPSSRHPTNHKQQRSDITRPSTNHIQPHSDVTKQPTNHLSTLRDVTVLLANHGLSSPMDQSPPSITSRPANQVSSSRLTSFKALHDKKDSEPAAITPPTATTTTTTTTTTNLSEGPQQVEEEEEEKGERKNLPMAFTIDISDSSNSSADLSSKKLDISASLSKWAPKHRRNLSLTKVDEHKKVEERSSAGGGTSKPPLGRPRSGTVGGLSGLRRGGGYHSEGYFSSDQDEEGTRRQDLKSPRSPRTPELRSPQTPQRLVRSSSQDSAKGASSRKQTGKTEGRPCCRNDKKPTLSEATGRTKSDKNKGCEKMSVAGSGRQSAGYNNNHNLELKHNNSLTDSNKEEKDDVSEAGTYTIDKDSSSPEVEQARSDIDRVFGVSGTESEVERDPNLIPRASLPPSASTTLPPPEESWAQANALDHQKFKSPGVSRSNPNWIQQWAAQVAEHTKTAEHKNQVQRGRAAQSLSSSQESDGGRPRRKLPTPPTGPSALKGGDVSDSDTTTNTAPGLKGRTRVDQRVSNLRATHSFESHDSGGDSDLDTSTSYPIQDERMTRQLKARLKLVGIEGGGKTPPSASPRRPQAAADQGFRRERSIVSDGGYDGFGLGDDSSSDGGGEGVVKDAVTGLKKADNNPPLKFNRAFSLRRARLGCDESQPTKPPSPVDKKKTPRPSSAGSLPSGRKLPLGHTKSQSIGGIRTAPQGTSGGAKTGGGDFSRGDGGRFSLRIPRSGSTSAVSKSPSRASKQPNTTAAGTRKGNAGRSNSTLSAKEVDFQNWKRRKNYDPMKAAAEGRKKVNDKRNEKQQQLSSAILSGTASTTERSPSPPGSLLRSASFHGTEGVGMGAVGRWPRPRMNHSIYPSEDEGPYSLEEEAHPVPHCSPLRRSPTSPHHLCSPHNTSPSHTASARRRAYALSDEGETHLASPTRKGSLDESGSEGKMSPISTTRGMVSSRSKTKMEALDNLVISTIHSLSVKVRTTSETLLQKLKSQYDEEGDRAALLEEVLSHLSESDQATGGSGGGGRSTSRELAGILRNLKKIENALEVIDRVMISDDDDDDDDDDGGVGVGGTDWGESDY